MNATLVPLSHKFHLEARGSVILDGIVLVTLYGALVTETRQALRWEIEEFLAAGYTRFVLDCSDCTWMDSSGIGCLISLARRATFAPHIGQGFLRLAELNEELTDLFAQTKLDLLFTPYVSVCEALAA